MAQVTIQDIARKAGVSVTTVSRVLNHHPSVHPETRERVLRVCRKLGYRANLLARSLSSSRSGVLGIILPDISNPFYAALSLHIELCAKEKDYQIMLCKSRPEDQEMESLMRFFLGQQVDGILLPNASSAASELLSHYSAAIPSVLIGGAAPEESGMRMNSVSTDNYTGTRLAAEYLHRLGHRDVIYLGHRERSYTHALRHAGFLAAAEQLHMRVTTIRSPYFHSSIAIGNELARPLFSSPLSATALFTPSDMLALGVMQAADEAGIRIPEDLSLMGYDNIEYASLPKIRLTTVAQPIPQLARSSVRLLLERIEADRDGEFVRRLLPPSIVERSSCAPPRASAM